MIILTEIFEIVTYLSFSGGACDGSQPLSEPFLSFQIYLRGCLMPGPAEGGTSPGRDPSGPPIMTGGGGSWSLGVCGALESGRSSSTILGSWLGAVLSATFPEQPHNPINATLHTNMTSFENMRDPLLSKDFPSI
jgi:hypothetical protein